MDLNHRLIGTEIEYVKIIYYFILILKIIMTNQN